jgi:hypothetical protein
MGMAIDGKEKCTDPTKLENNLEKNLNAPSPPKKVQSYDKMTEDEKIVYFSRYSELLTNNLLDQKIHKTFEKLFQQYANSSKPKEQEKLKKKMVNLVIKHDKWDGDYSNANVREKDTAFTNSDNVTVTLKTTDEVLQDINSHIQSGHVLLKDIEVKIRSLMAENNTNKVPLDDLIIHNTSNTSEKINNNYLNYLKRRDSGVASMFLEDEISKVAAQISKNYKKIMSVEVNSKEVSKSGIRRMTIKIKGSDDPIVVVICVAPDKETKKCRTDKGVEYDLAKIVTMYPKGCSTPGRIVLSRGLFFKCPYYEL